MQYVPRTTRLEKAIRDFKAYDADRKKYVRKIEAENNELQDRNSRLMLEIQTLNQKIDALIDSYDNARPMKDNSGNKAYVKELLDKIALSPMSSQNLVGLDNALAREVLSLRKGMATLQTKNSELKKENRILKKTLGEDYDTN